jgi:hypothetical protein
LKSDLKSESNNETSNNDGLKFDSDVWKKSDPKPLYIKEVEQALTENSQEY